MSKQFRCTFDKLFCHSAQRRLSTLCSIDAAQTRSTNANANYNNNNISHMNYSFAVIRSKHDMDS